LQREGCRRGKVKEDIDPKVREVWKMQFRPIDEVVRDIHMRDAREAGIEEGREEGREEGKFEVARKMLSRKMSVSDIIDITGLNEKDILSL
jgi:predicted transposase/invertase (TIGR01784 family)